MRPLELTLTRGGTAVLVETDGDVVVLRATVACPPGAPLEGTAADGSGTYRVKVRGCRRCKPEEGDGFRVDGRFVSLTRGQREHLLG